jgi:transposase
LCSDTVPTVMGGEVATLPTDVGELRHLVAALQKEVAVLHDELRILRHRIFGRRSERYSPEEQKQSGLFDEADGQQAATPQEATQAVIPVAAHSRAKPGRRPLPADLPREEVVHDIPEEEKRCSCGQPLVRIDEEASEKLDIIPAQLKVIRHIRPKYACPNCEGHGSEHPVKCAPMPPQLIERGIATPGLLAFILTSKFCDAVPFYRQERQFERIGIELPRGDFCNWAVQVGRRCDPLMQIFLDEIRAGPAVQMDETRLQVMKEHGRADTAQSFMWVLRGGPPEKPVIVYRYHPTRSASVPLEYLRGYTGFLQTDGYDGYEEVGALPGVTHVGCWAHARRKFDEAAKASKNGGSAHEAVGRIAKLYAAERELRALQLPADEFLTRRKTKVLPILESFKGWLDSKATQVLPSALLGKAIGYTLNEWSKLVRYLYSPYLTPDTNHIENAIRPFVVGRKNWLFSGSPLGAHASATLYSLIETAKANGIEPYRYLRYIFAKLPLAKDREDFLRLTPQGLDFKDFMDLSA